MVAKKRMTRTVRSLRNGQITIPAEFRRELDITDESLLQMTLDGDELHITKVRAISEVDGSPWLAELYRRFAPVRQEAEDAGYTEGEINEAIDQALAEVRAKDA